MLGEDDDFTWGHFAEVLDALMSAYGQLSPPRGLQEYHDASLHATESLRDHARTRTSADSFIEEFLGVAFELLGAALEIGLDTTKTDAEKEQLIEAIEKEILGEFFGPDFVAASQAVDEVREALPEETLALLDDAGCYSDITAVGEDQAKTVANFEEPGTSLGTFLVGEAPRVGDYQIWVSRYSKDDRGETSVRVEIANIGERALAYPDCDRNMILQDQARAQYGKTSCSWQHAGSSDEIPPGGVSHYGIRYQPPEDAAGLVWRFSADTVGVDFALDAAVDDVTDDHGDSASDSTAATVGESVQGRLDYDGDVDFFVFQAVQGELYQIDVALATLFDAKLTLYDADERFQVRAGDDFGDPPAPRIIWTAPASGSYYVALSDDCTFDPCIGSYTLTVGLSVIIDDHADDTQNATAISVGEAIEGVIDYDGDSDYFRFTAESGQIYQIDMELGTLEGPYFALLGSDGWQLVSNELLGESEPLRIIGAVQESGEYYVQVSSWRGDTGSYTLTVSLSDIVDDHADEVDGATAISVGETTGGAIDYEGDSDVFRFTVEAGQIYQIDVELGTLENSYLSLLNSDGYEFESNDDHGESKASRITWLAKESGDYYLRVSPAWDGGTGSYTLTVDRGSANAISAGVATDGVIEYDGDSGIFRFQAKAGQLYMLDVTLGTLSDSSMTIYDASGVRLEDNDDYEDSFASRIFWEAPVAGDYYVEVESDWEEGSYTLTVTEYVAEAAWRGNTDYDLDDNGFIEVSDLAQLNAIRWDLDGSGLPEHPTNNPLYAAAFPNAADRMGCPREECLGYEITTDLDFDTNGSGSADSGDAYWNDGLGWDPIGWNAFIDGAFTGLFKGRGHTISNLYINRSDTDQVGLFGRVSFSGLNRWAVRGDIRDVGLIDVQVTGRSEVGGLVGDNGVTIAACYVTGSVKGDREVGGLIGSNFSGEVVASYAAVSVTGDSEVGGLVGQNFAGDIEASYAAGSVTGNSGVGGLVGGNTFGSGTVTDSYWDTQTSGQSDSAGGEGKTTRELQSPTGYIGIYENWNLDLDGDGEGDDLWDFGASSQYPTLKHRSVPVVASTPALTATPTPTPSPTGASTPDTDRAALAALYNATDGPNWTNITNWLSDASIGEWHGVTADDDGRVVELWLNDNDLTGHIPTQLGNLSNLTFLGLWENQLTGTIPAELGNLANLTELWLIENELSGQIPAELGNLSNLIKLYLGGNELSGQIPAELGNLSNLRELGFGSGQLSGRIPPELGRLSNLTRLWLDRNKLSGQIPAELGKLSNLIWLGLEDNQLNGKIPADLGSLSNLEVLYLSDNQLSGCIPMRLRDVPTNDLEDLGLPDCNEAAGREESPDRAALVALYNATDGPNWTNNDNWLSDAPIGEWYGVTTDDSGRVISLSFVDNRLSGELPPELGSLTNLTLLSIIAYDLDGELSGEIPLELGSLTNLELVTLWGNQLRGEIPPELGSLTNLIALGLSSNQLTGEIPSELGSLTNLTGLGLGDNQLTGEIPSDLGNLTNLQWLHLSGNELTGCIPAELRNVLGNDLDELGLPYCDEAATEPMLVSTTLSQGHRHGCGLRPDGTALLMRC